MCRNTGNFPLLWKFPDSFMGYFHSTIVLFSITSNVSVIINDHSPVPSRVLVCGCLDASYQSQARQAGTINLIVPDYILVGCVVVQYPQFLQSSKQHMNIIQRFCYKAAQLSSRRFYPNIYLRFDCCFFFSELC